MTKCNLSGACHSCCRVCPSYDRCMQGRKCLNYPDKCGMAKETADKRGRRYK